MASTPTIAAVPVLPAATVNTAAVASSPNASLASAGTGKVATARVPLIDLGGSFSNFSIGMATPKPVLPAASLRILPSVVSEGVAA